MKYPPRSAGDLCGLGEVPRPVFGIDIDGTLGQYHAHFWAFAQDYLGKSLPVGWGYSGGSFAAYLGLSKTTYRKVKLAYRRGGIKRSMPVVDGAPALVSSLRKRGALVVLCTTRPYLSVENIDEDTRHWAKRNRVQHDGILWGPHKYRDLSRAFGRDRIVGALEDEPEMLRQAAAVGIRPLRIEQPYNREWPFDSARGLLDAELQFHNWLDEWERRQ